MNSSTSASKPSAWGRLLRQYVVSCALLAIVLGTLLVALDPYDTGRLALVRGSSVPHFEPRLTAASLARDPEKNAAIIGNSTVQLLDPARLSESTGLTFVSLAVPGTGPLEELVIADWYLRRHRLEHGKAPEALVIDLDESWCRADGRLEITNPFPFWLYSESTLVYIGNLLRLKSFEAAARKLKVMVGYDPPIRSDGYRDYDAGRQWDAASVEARLAEKRFDPTLPDTIQFAAIPRLRKLMDAVPGNAAVVLVFVPRYYTALPSPGSNGDRLLRLCKDAYRRIAAERPRTAVLDWLVDSALVRDEQSFWDQVHFRQPVARIMERGIADVIRETRTAALPTLPTPQQ